MNTNSPPFCTLELTKEEAELLLTSAEASMRVALVGMQMSRNAMRSETLRELVNNTELFKSVRNKLKAQGIKSNED